MCHGSSAVSSNRAVASPLPLTLERLPGNASPIYAQPNDEFVPKKKKAAPPPRSIIDKVVDAAREVIPAIGKLITDGIGRASPVVEHSVSAPR